MRNQCKIAAPVMFVGTGSDVGKSVLTAGFCRVLKQDGYRPAPFKAQNMSLNSYVTPEGGELGRAQAVQAEACGIPCHTDMNPILLKPNHDTNSQVILNGKVVGNYSARSYFRKEGKQELWQEALKAFHRLGKRYNPVVIEGAGSISELNLKKNDIVNMSIAVATGANTFLVADIDRGGVFASVYGSVMLLEPEERERIKGIIINKFRGDITLFEEGRKILEKLTGIPVLGVVPYYRDIHIEEEDSVALERKFVALSRDKVNIAVVGFPRMSNFTDFDCLARDARVNLYFTIKKEQLEQAEIIILPGSKNTISDLLFIKSKGLDKVIVEAFKKGKSVVGICGGYQMLGEKIYDPEEVESSEKVVAGLGIFPAETVLEKEKTTRQTTFRYRTASGKCKGYEIHMGTTTFSAKIEPLNYLENEATEGCFLREGCWGTYMHGILDNAQVINELLASFSKKALEAEDYEAFKQKQYDKLAAHLRAHCDMDLFYKIIQD